MNKKYCIIFSEPDDWSTNDVMDWITFFNRIPLRINANKILNAEFCFDFHSPSNCFVFLTKKISFKEVLENNLKIMDSTAFTLAREHRLPIRVFNIFHENALLKAAQSTDFGSIIE